MKRNDDGFGTDWRVVMATSPKYNMEVDVEKQQNFAGSSKTVKHTFSGNENNLKHIHSVTHGIQKEVSQHLRAACAEKDSVLTLPFC